MYKMIFVFLLFLLLIPVCHSSILAFLRKVERISSKDFENSEQVINRMKDKMKSLEGESAELLRKEKFNKSEKTAIEKFLSEKNKTDKSDKEN